MATQTKTWRDVYVTTNKEFIYYLITSLLLRWKGKTHIYYRHNEDWYV